MSYFDVRWRAVRPASTPGRWFTYLNSVTLDSAIDGFRYLVDDASMLGLAHSHDEEQMRIKTLREVQLLRNGSNVPIRSHVDLRIL